LRLAPALHASCTCHPLPSHVPGTPTTTMILLGTRPLGVGCGVHPRRCAHTQRVVVSLNRREVPSPMWRCCARLHLTRCGRQSVSRLQRAEYTVFSSGCHLKSTQNHLRHGAVAFSLPYIGWPARFPLRGTALDGLLRQGIRLSQLRPLMTVRRPSIVHPSGDAALCRRGSRPPVAVAVRRLLLRAAGQACGSSVGSQPADDPTPCCGISATHVAITHGLLTTILWMMVVGQVGPAACALGGGGAWPGPAKQAGSPSGRPAAHHSSTTVTTYLVHHPAAAVFDARGRPEAATATPLTSGSCNALAHGN